MGILYPSQTVGHQVEREKRQKGQQKALYVVHEPSRRQISVSQLNFVSEYKEYIGLWSLGTNLNLHEVPCSYHKG